MPRIKNIQDSGKVLVGDVHPKTLKEKTFILEPGKEADISLSALSELEDESKFFLSGSLVVLDESGNPNQDSVGPNTLVDEDVKKVLRTKNEELKEIVSKYDSAIPLVKLLNACDSKSKEDIIQERLDYINGN